MFYLNNIKINKNQIENQYIIAKPRYNLDMIHDKICRIENMKIKQEFEKQRKNRIKSLKIAGPKNNKKWSVDIFEEVKYEEQKNKIKALKLLQPIKEETINMDPTYISDWDDISNDWIEKDNNICV
jgi:hypothetical protein